MTELVNEVARIESNDCVGPRLYLLVLKSPQIASRIRPGQFVHIRFPQLDSHVLRRPFSVYARDAGTGIVEVLYQEVGSVTGLMPGICTGEVELIGPVGNSWSTDCSRALLVGGGVGAAPLFMLAESLKDSGAAVDVVLGAQTKAALVTRGRYAEVLGAEPLCATDDGTYGRAGFCTSLVQERLEAGCTVDGKPYDQVAVCGPEPLMKIVASQATEAGVPCQVSLEKRMACGIGACLSCVVDTVGGRRRSCVDGPVFDASEVVW